MKIHNIFISHSWTYSNAYHILVDFLDAGNYFNYKNYSVPKDDPIHNARYDYQLEQAIERKIRPCSAVVIMAGKYATYSKWITKEIEIAKRLGKPIIGIAPWGNQQISSIVRDNAIAVVRWNTESIIRAIKEYSI